MCKFKNGDIAIVTENQDNILKRGQIGKITDDRDQYSLLFVPKYPINKYKEVYVIYKQLALLSSIPLNKICVYTETKEQWDSVCKYIGATNSFYKGAVKWLASPDNYCSINAHCSLDPKHIEKEMNGYLISYGEFIDYIVPMHFFTVKDKTSDDFPDPEGLPLDLLSIQ